MGTLEETLVRLTRRGRRERVALNDPERAGLALRLPAGLAWWYAMGTLRGSNHCEPARPEGREPPTVGLENRCSIPLRSAQPRGAPHRPGCEAGSPLTGGIRNKHCRP